MSSFFRAIYASAVVSLFWTMPVHAQYRFSVIADFAPRPFQFVQSPPINERGQVAFMTPSSKTPQGVEGLSVNRIELPGILTLVQSGFADSQSRSLNILGHAAYIQNGVFVADGHHARKIADPPDDPETTFHSAALNERGTVAFAADLDEDGNTALYLRRLGADLTTVSDGSTGSLNFHSPPALDEANRVVFSAYDSADTHTTDVFLYNNGTITRLYERGVGPFVSAKGMVTFTRLEQTVGATTILRGDERGAASPTGAPIVIANSNGPFTRVLADGVNDSGQVVFRGSLAGGGLAVCISDGKVTARVLQTGNTLLGRTVANLSPASINNRGEVALEATFTDGSAAILRAKKDH